MLSQTRIRLDAIKHVLALRERWIAVPASELRDFRSEGRNVFLRGTQGIFKPKELSEPLSLQSTLQSPYAASLADGRKVLYEFLPRSREHDNEGLKRCGAYGLPLIYLLQVKASPRAEYEIFAPVYICGWDDKTRQFQVDLSGQPVDHLGVAPSMPELQLSLPNVPLPENPREIRELASGYLVHAVQRRFSHARFRSAVLRVYRDRCAVCLLGLRPLLDAARITPGDDDEAGEPRDGVSLCAVHLRAFQAGILTWDAAYIVRIRLGHAIAGEGERSMLLSFDGKPLALPRDERHWPALPEAK